jgi:hypothetical protein
MSRAREGLPLPCDGNVLCLCHATKALSFYMQSDEARELVAFTVSANIKLAELYRAMGNLHAAEGCVDQAECCLRAHADGSNPGDMEMYGAICGVGALAASR